MSDWTADLGLQAPRRPRRRTPIPMSPDVEVPRGLPAVVLCWDGQILRLRHDWDERREPVVCLFCGRRR